MEEAAYRCVDLARTNLAHLSPNRATHLKSPEKRLQIGLFAWLCTDIFGHSLISAVDFPSVSLMSQRKFQFSVASSPLSQNVWRLLTSGELVRVLFQDC